MQWRGFEWLPHDLKLTIRPQFFEAFCQSVHLTFCINIEDAGRDYRIWFIIYYMYSLHHSKNISNVQISMYHIKLQSKQHMQISMIWKIEQKAFNIHLVFWVDFISISSAFYKIVVDPMLSYGEETRTKLQIARTLWSWA